MTLDELRIEVLKASEDKPKEWRLGQFVFNYIEANYGDVARKVQFIDKIDCFYRDESINSFLNACINRINYEN